MLQNVGTISPDKYRESSRLGLPLYPCVWEPMLLCANGRPCAQTGSSNGGGIFVGVQHPMVLILRKRDMKLLSVSKKKFIAYESLYTSPLTYSSAKLKTCLEERFEEIDKSEIESSSAQHVLSTKSMASHTIIFPFPIQRVFKTFARPLCSTKLLIPNPQVRGRV